MLMYKHFDFCALNHFPSLIFCAKHERILAQNGIYVNACVDLQGHNNKYILLGNTHATLEISAHPTAILYMKDRSFLRVEGSDLAIVMIEAYDNAEIQMEISGEARAIVRLHQEAQLYCEETKNIRIIRHEREGHNIQD